MNEHVAIRHKNTHSFLARGTIIFWQASERANEKVVAPTSERIGRNAFKEFKKFSL